MKLDRTDFILMCMIVISLALGSDSPLARDNDVIRVGWVIIHMILFMGYLVGTSVLTAIEELESLIISNTDKEE